MLKYTKISAEQVDKGAAGEMATGFQIPFLAGNIQGFKLITLIVQLVIVIATIRVFNVEDTSALHIIIPFIFGGFIVNAVLKPALRLPFFVLLSVAAIVAVFGVVNGGWLIGISLGLIGLCHVPIPFKARLALIFSAVGALVVLRGGWVGVTSWSELIMPVLGAMFMFRLVIYVHDLRHERKPASLWERLAYFFMLPNVAFPLFPVIDYQLFRRTYYNEDEYKIYQKGVLWIFRGVTHLILYRAVYYYLVPTPEEVQGLGQLVLFIVSSYLIYLRVSGLFHVIIGILCLFGMNLPETHHHYFLAAEFNEVWRKLNIYWKDFMAKVLYYPLVMKIRKWGMMRARVLGTMLVFVATWLLHSYQWFWLRGDFPLNVIDGMYWGILGMFVVINTVRTTKDLKGNAEDEDTSWSWARAAKRSWNILGIFVFMSVLWSFWASESISSWWYVMMVAGSGSLQEYGLLVLGVAVIFGALMVHLYMDHHGKSLLWNENELPFYNVATRTVIASACVLCIGLPMVHSNFGTSSSDFIASLQESRLNDRDQGIQERGYYEGLIDGNSYNIAQINSAGKDQKPDNWKATMNSDAVRPGTDVIVYELKPNYSDLVKDAPFVTNQWGMRDKEYSLEKEDGTFRIAFLGASYEQGAGVPNEKIFPALIEDYLNDEHSGNQYDNYEVLSFAVGGYSPIQAAYLTEHKVLDFEPDLILYAVHSTEHRRLLMQLQKLSLEKREVSLGFLNEIFEEAEVTPDIPDQEARRRLTPYAGEIIKQSFLHMRGIAEREEIPVIAAFVRSTEEIKEYDPKWHPRLKEYAREANFTVITLEDTYQGYNEADIQLTSWDTHLNEKGHELVAQSLYKALVENEAFSSMAFSTGSLEME